jgi:hypothetical protein
MKTNHGSRATTYIGKEKKNAQKGTRSRTPRSASKNGKRQDKANQPDKRKRAPHLRPPGEENQPAFATQNKKSGQYTATQPNQSKNSNNNNNNQPQ